MLVCFPANVKLSSHQAALISQGKKANFRGTLILERELESEGFMDSEEDIGGTLLSLLFSSSYLLVFSQLFFLFSPDD